MSVGNIRNTVSVPILWSVRQDGVPVRVIERIGKHDQRTVFECFLPEHFGTFRVFRFPLLRYFTEVEIPLCTCRNQKHWCVTSVILVVIVPADSSELVLVMHHGNIIDRVMLIPRQRVQLIVQQLLQRANTIWSFGRWKNWTFAVFFLFDLLSTLRLVRVVVATET